MRLLKIAAAAAVLLVASGCEKPEDRAVLATRPKFDLRYCISGAHSPTLRMPASGCLMSDNRAYVLMLAPDGDLEVRRVSGGRVADAVWTSGAKAAKAGDPEAVFQDDGNLVVYQAGQAVWNSGALGAETAHRLVLTDDGNLLIRSADGRPQWMARFDVHDCDHALDSPARLSGGCLVSPSGAFAMVMEPGGAAAVAPVSGGRLGPPVWSTHSAGSAPRSAFFALQEDGNLVIYDAGKPIWNSETSGHSGKFRLELSDQGELVLRTASGVVLWSSKGGRKA